jgi:hypothetical protein
LTSGIRKLVADWQVSRMRRRMRPEMVAFPADLLKPKHVLVCLPAGLRELTLVKQYLPDITAMFKPADVTLLALPDIKVFDIYPRKGFQILTPSREQLSWSGLPSRPFLKMLMMQNFDTILDLNLDVSSFPSSILLCFPKAVRIGRGNHLGEPFYNLEIKTKYLRDERNIYKTLLETLGAIINRRPNGVSS